MLGSPRSPTSARCRNPLSSFSFRTSSQTQSQPRSHTLSEQEQQQQIQEGKEGFPDLEMAYVDALPHTGNGENDTGSFVPPPSPTLLDPRSPMSFEEMLKLDR